MTVFQRVEQARRVADILHGCEALSPADGINHVARAAEVVEIQIAVAQGLDRAAAPAHGDAFARVRDTLFHEFRREQDTLLLDARAMRGEQVTRASVLDGNPRLAQDAERGVVEGVDLVGGEECEQW